MVYNVRTDAIPKHRAERRLHKLAAAPDMFISLHCDSAGPSAEGETVIYNPENSKDKKFAETVNRAMAEDTTFVNRGAKVMEKNLGVLMGDSQGKIAEILIEMGFISNQQDYDKLRNNITRKKQLEAIANGVLNYYQQEISPNNSFQIAAK